MTDAQTQITCQEFVELVTDLLEGQLAEARRIEAEIHMGGCPGCEAYLEQMRQTIAALRTLARAGDLPRTRADALAAFRELRATS
jgi:anti-sigma factor RsiW